MNIKYTIVPIALVMLLAVTGIMAQQASRTGQGTLRGLVVDEESAAPLEFAALSILSPQDSSLVSGGVTDLDGAFAVQSPGGTYLLKVEYISYAPKYIPNIEVQAGQETDLGTLTMSMSSAQLAEVEVVAERSQVELGLDKRVFNVEKDLVTRSGNAADVLDNIPSVTVDLEGNVSLRGSGNVRILINGRQTGLGNAAIRSLQGNMIERVEVITNPSARYDAEGMSGIINIVLKKNQEKGINGAFSTNLSYPLGGGLDGQINVRRKNLNFFTSVGVQYRESPGSGSLYQEYYQEDQTTYLEQTRDRVRKGISQNLRAGMDWFINPSNTLTGSLFFRYGNDNSETEIRYEDYDPDYNLDLITIRTDDEAEVEPNMEYNLNYKRLFGSKEHTLTADFQFEDSRETETSDYREVAFNPDGSEADIPELIQRSENDEGQTQYLLQTDYVRPLGEEGKFETGFKGTYRRINNDFIVEELQDDEWVVLENLSNDFRYDETILAAYAIYGDKKGRFSYQVGTRLEYSDIITELLETEEVNARDYLNLFPSAHVGYEFKGQNTVQVSYSRRISRPHFRWLNPFFSFSDSRNVWTGNPNLDPEYTSQVELGHIKYWDKASLSTSLYYRYTTDVIQRVRKINDEGITITMPENLARRDAWGLDMSFNVDLLEAWSVDGNVNVFRQITEGGEIGRADDYSWQGRLNSRLTLFKTVETQLRFNYRGPVETPQGITKSYVFADIGLSKDILNGRGTLTLNIRDVFNSRKRRYIAEGEGFFSEGEFQWRARTTTLTFNYRLNQNKRRSGGRGGNGGNYDGGGEF